MASNPILEEVLRLPPAERIKLIEDAWESLAASESCLTGGDHDR